MSAIRRPRPSARPLEPAPPSSWPLAVLLAASLGLGLAAFANFDPSTSEDQVTGRPIARPDNGYVSSDTCQSCHPGEYASWHGSFHRTMTQVASETSVRADFAGVEVTNTHGRPMRLERVGDEFWAEFDDPGWEGPDADRPRIRRQVVLVTGSHHQNIYWYATEHERGLNVLPSVYLIKEARWASRSAVVLHPPNQSLAMLDGHWNAICIACHTTQGKTAFSTPFRSEAFRDQTIDTTVAEFGIACESCHGPAEEHIQAHRNPVQRYRQRLTDAPDPTIVQPTRLDPQRSSQVCGQCHSVWEFYDLEGERLANEHGLPYRPGDELRDTRFVAQPSVDRSSDAIRTLAATDPEFLRGSFWPDGTIRVSGREYNGLLDSPCFRDASTPERTLSCFSCHAMHKPDNDPRSVVNWADTHQMATGMESNEACLQCHEPIRANEQAHTRHAAGSSGSSCYNCHMPYTSYGLLKTVRSHTISSPSVTESVRLSRPNACNLCHLDQTLGWTAEQLEAWYDISSPPLSEDQRSVAASLVWLLGGDAGLRAITAQAMGWTPAQAVSGTSWMVPHLGEALGDDYDAVRFIAARALRSIPEAPSLTYDFDGPREVRVAAAISFLRAWRGTPARTARRAPELLIDADGELRLDVMRRLAARGDRRPLFLRE